MTVECSENISVEKMVAMKDTDLVVAKVIVLAEMKAYYSVKRLDVSMVARMDSSKVDLTDASREFQ